MVPAPRLQLLSAEVNTNPDLKTPFPVLGRKIPMLREMLCLLGLNPVQGCGGRGKVASLAADRGVPFASFSAYPGTLILR